MRIPKHTETKIFIPLNVEKPFDFFQQTEIDAETMEPLPALTQATRDWCREVGLLHAETVRDVMDAAERGRSFAGQSNPPSGFDLECVRFVQAVDNAIGRANQKAISNAQRIQKWAILATDFSIPGGEMGTHYWNNNWNNDRSLFFFTLTMIRSNDEGEAWCGG